MYTRESLDLLKQIIDPKDVLISLGSVSANKISDSGDEIRCPCPIHGGDNRTSFVWKRSTGTWNCFSHGCGRNIPHDVFGFLKAKYNLNFIQAAELLSKTFGIQLEKGSNIVNTFNYSIQSLKQANIEKKYKPELLKSLSYLPGYHQEGFDYMVEYLRTRNYNYEDIKEFNLYPSLDFLNILRVAIPVYDDCDTLVGINARLLDSIMNYPEYVEKDGNTYYVPKYRMNKFPKGSVLFNLNRAKCNALVDGIILVEGQFDVIRLHTYGINNVVCTMGTTLTTEQIALLYKYCYRITFLVEEGEAAWSGVMKSIKNIQDGMRIFLTRLPSGDADSNPKTTIDACLKKLYELSKKDIKSIKNGDTWDYE